MQAVKSTIAENFGGSGQKLAGKDQQFILEEVPDLSGKVAVVTGGSEGIGYGCTHTLLSHNVAKVFILSPSKDVVDGAVDSISSEMGEAAAKKVKWLQLDLTDWPAVAKTAKDIHNSTDRLDILINNAGRGIMTYQLTDYGVDRHMALNHFGHVILTSHLMPLMKKTASDKLSKIRIVNLASNAHQGTPSSCKFESLDELNTDLGPNGNYGRSKLAAILYSRYMNKHLTSTHPNILVNATHPGFVSTKMSKDDIHEPYPLGGYAMSKVMEPFKKDQFEGCVSTMFAATKTENSGQYICPPAIVEEGTSQAQDMNLAESLMKLTREVVAEKTKSQSVDKGCPLQFY